MSWRAGIALAASLGACAPVGPPSLVTGGGALTASVWFEPPLHASASVRVLHESGYTWMGTASATGVTLVAPEGPCTLTLERGGVVLAETSLKLSRSVSDYHWVLAP